MLTGAMYDPQLHEAYRLLIIKVIYSTSSTFVRIEQEPMISVSMESLTEAKVNVQNLQHVHVRVHLD